MTAQPPPLEYATPAANVTCPLCNDRPTTAKTIYGRKVCKKCYYKFANRRQFAFLIDNLLFAIPVYAIIFFIFMQLPEMNTLQFEGVTIAIGLVTMTLFNMKDGFQGQSPGKRITGVQVVDSDTGEPISFGQSLKRNAIFYVGLIPMVGGLAHLIAVVAIIIQMSKGPRLGDRFANTRVIWRRYAASSVFGGDDRYCTSCHYDLTGNTSGICPECGKAVPAWSLTPG